MSQIEYQGMIINTTLLDAIADVSEAKRQSYRRIIFYWCDQGFHERNTQGQCARCLNIMPKRKQVC